MNYVRRAGRFVRKKLGSHHHHHHRHDENDEYGSHRHDDDEHSHSSTMNGTWDGQMPVLFLHSDAVTCLGVAEPGLSLSGSKDNSVVLYNFKKRFVEARWCGHSKEVTKVVRGTNGNVYSASRDKTIRSWKGDLGCPLQTFNGHELVVTGLDVSQDGERLCSGSRDNSVKLWDVESASCVRSVNVSRNLVTDLNLGRGQPIVVQTSEDKELHLWDARNLSITQTFSKKLYIQTCCSLAEDETYCLTGSNGFGGNGCEATLWDLRATQPVLEYRGHHETVGACAFLPPISGRQLLMTSSHDATVRVWDRNTAACVCCLALSGAGPLTSLAVHPDFSILVSSFNRGITALRLAVEASGEVRLTIENVF